MEFAGTALPLTNADIDAAAVANGVLPAAFHAVSDNESAGSGFLLDKRPKILFEARQFHIKTAGAFDARWPNISSPVWDRSLYGAGGAHQYDRLQFAIGLPNCREAGLCSVSMGRFQIMGANHSMVGFDSADSMMTAMMASERNHLDAFVAFCKASGALRHLQSPTPDFAGFSNIYNGPGYAENGYDTKMAGSFRKWMAAGAAAPMPNPAPRTVPEAYHATLQLGSKGDEVGRVQAVVNVDATNDYDENTEAAVAEWQQAHGLNDDGVVGPITRAAMRL